MPRYLRALVQGYPHHIIQRGHDRQPVFAEDRDFGVYLENLNEQLDILNISLFSYCLMTNHVHLLVQPERDGADLSRLMRVVAARQTRHVNRLEDRIGTLWAGRFKCSIVDSEKYLLACCRYIELNPVRAGMVRDPGDYSWSSYRQRIGLIVPTVVLAPIPIERIGEGREEDSRRRHALFIAGGQTTELDDSIRTAVNRNQLTGDSRFRHEIEKKLNRRISDKAPGRPRKSSGEGVV